MNDLINIARYRGAFAPKNPKIQAKTELIMPSQKLWGRGYESVADRVLFSFPWLQLFDVFIPS